MSQDEQLKKVNILLSCLDGSGSASEYEAIKNLRNMLGSELPSILSREYEKSRKWQQRCSYVFFSIRSSRENLDAVKLGIKALNDRSKKVRYRACMLLAWSLSKDALGPLQQAKVLFNDEDTLDNICAAIDAIENKNSNYFVDRSHSGKIRLKIVGDSQE
ncbi:MAG: hypothetical protein KDI90_12530 [Alphaproteobacteria bacterium]|nr:hypothetical protein [Alphaproteobacteria bacterium]